MLLLISAQGWLRQLLLSTCQHPSVLRGDRIWRGRSTNSKKKKRNTQTHNNSQTASVVLLKVHTCNPPHHLTPPDIITHLSLSVGADGSVEGVEEVFDRWRLQNEGDNLWSLQIERRWLSKMKTLPAVFLFLVLCQAGLKDIGCDFRGCIYPQRLAQCVVLMSLQSLNQQEKSNKFLSSVIILNIWDL